MKKKNYAAVMSIVMTVTVTGMLLAGCQNTNGAGQGASQETVTAEDAAGDSADNAEAGNTEETSEGLYFSRGVYNSYIKGEEEPKRHDYYLFDSPTEGATADGDHHGMGLGFAVEQKEGSASFTFAAADEEPEVLIVTDTEDGSVYGHFENKPEEELVFEPIEGADPDTFDAEAYAFSLQEDDRAYFRDKMNTHKQKIKVEECSSFEDVIEKKLESGQGYATVDLDGTEVLLVSPQTFQADGKNLSVDAELFVKGDDGTIAYLGYVTTGGSATPLAYGDNKLWSSSHHYTFDQNVKDGELIFFAEGWETSDKDGNVTYHYSSYDGTENGAEAEDEIEKLYNELEQGYMNAEAIAFEAVQ